MNLRPQVRAAARLGLAVPIACAQGTLPSTPTPDRELPIEGVGVVPDLMLPVTYDSVMGTSDAVDDAAI